MTRFHFLALFAALFLAFPAALTGSSDALSLIPSNAISVGMVRVSDMRSSPILGHLISEMDRVTVDGEADRFLRESGLEPAQDLDTVTFALLPAETLRSEGRLLCIFEGRFQAEKLVNAIAARGGKKISFGNVVYLREEKDNGAVAFLSDHLAVAGSEEAVRSALALRSAGGSDFERRSLIAPLLVHVDPTANAWAIIDVGRARRLTGGPAWSGAQNDTRDALVNALVSDVKSIESVVLWSRESARTLELGARATARDDETAESIDDLVRGALAAWRIGVSEKAPQLLPVIRRFDVVRDGRSVSVRGSIPASILRDGMKRTGAKEPSR